MPKKTKENLSIDKILALIEAKGELGSYIKRQKLAHSHLKPEERIAGYRNCQMLMDAIKGNPGWEAKLENQFLHMPELALQHYRSADCLEVHEFFIIKSFLWAYLSLQDVLSRYKLDVLHPLPDLMPLFELLDPEANHLPSFRLSPLYSPELKGVLDRQQSLALRLKSVRADDLHRAKQELDITNLKDEFVISRSRSELLARLMQSKWFVLTRESLANCSFSLADSEQAITIKAELDSLAQAQTDAEDAVLQELTIRLKEQLDSLETAWFSCAELLWDFALAQFALRYNCCIPTLDDNFMGIAIKQAVNLPLKLYLESRNRTYQSLDIALSGKNNLLTGPNMGGKSTALITLGQLCYLAILGIPLPAAQAHLPIYDEVYYNHDSGENSENLSSFGREVVAFALMLKRPGTKLILLDEFAKGTNPVEGETLCVATLKHLQSTPHTIFAATHFSAPTTLEAYDQYTIKGIGKESFTALESQADASLDARLKQLSEAMDYHLFRQEKRSAPVQCAIRIARLLGFPESILQQTDK